MCDKKNPSRFSIQFDTNNPEHGRVIEILTSKGRNKAQYITDAVLFYESNGSKDLRGTVTEIVTEILGITPDLDKNLLESADMDSSFDFADISDALEGFKK